MKHQVRFCMVFVNVTSAQGVGPAARVLSVACGFRSFGMRKDLREVGDIYIVTIIPRRRDLYGFCAVRPLEGQPRTFPK